MLPIVLSKALTEWMLQTGVHMYTPLRPRDRTFSLKCYVNGESAFRLCLTSVRTKTFQSWSGQEKLGVMTGLRTGPGCHTAVAVRPVVAGADAGDVASSLCVAHSLLARLTCSSFCCVNATRVAGNLH